MKRYILILIISIICIAMVYSKEYSNLDLPTILVMDFEVTVKTKYSEENEEKILNQDYYSQLINQSIVTALVKRNSSNNIIIEGDESFYYYFPPVLKIYDKKYVESALQKNNYDVSDLYQKNSNVFNFTDLDFIVLIA